jgi:hypothetical protein
MVRIVRLFKLTAGYQTTKMAALTVMLTLGVLHTELSLATERLQPMPSLASTSRIRQSHTSCDRLPHHLANRVRRDLARQLQIPRRRLSIVDYRRQVWSDGCLELATPGEFCTQAIVPGWRIELTDGTQRWVYHTDETGQTLRLQSHSTTTDETMLPDTVADRILEVAAQESGLSVAELKLVEAQPRLWDGCLGMAPPNGVCTQIAIDGWQAIVTSPTESWVYHSDGTGSDVRFNATASPMTGATGLSFIPAEELFYPGNNVVFQMTTKDGLAGTASKLLLLENGQVVQFVEEQGVETVTELARLSPRQVQAFDQQLQQYSFSHFNGLYYGSPTADTRTITVMGRGGTVRYADTAIDQLPSALQRVIQAWEQLIAANLPE